MPRPIGSTTRRNQIIIAVAAVLIALCCFGTIAAAFQMASSQPACVGGTWDDGECESFEGDDD